MLKLAIALFLGYFLGGIPFGLLVGWLARGIDVRRYGSGRTGFANVLRTCGVKAGSLTFVADVGKGVVAGLAGRLIFGSGVVMVGGLSLDWQVAQAVAAVAAIIGHCWSPYIRFQGGRGVDPALGGLFSMVPWAGAGCLVIGWSIILSTRYVSLGSMLGTFSSVVILAPFVILGRQPPEFVIYGALATIIVAYKHRDNIRRLRSGTERKLGQKGERR